MKKNYIIGSLVAVSVVFVAAFVIFNQLGNLEVSKSTKVQYENEIITSAPADVINPDTGEVDQEAFEKKQGVSQDTTLDALEAELNSTIILEEDFSDLN